ncbi:hypothetical protein [Sphingomonas sp. LHG3406-1]|uniref:hypothetical protein n=1 Tax=Sphingomonas sp. LHG3406-1 TaxID=2804617 RepID=UPI00261C1E7A|nr:hypothetical protein [Sphingomonas sp. LHG3406-1]
MNMVQVCRRLLLVGVAASVLSACGGGADDVASPGEGTLVGGGGGGGGGTPTPTPTPTGPAAACPTGTIDRGVNPVVNRRNCGLPARVSSALSLPKTAGLFYSIDGRVDVGTDVGGDGAAAGGQSATLSIDPGVVVVGQSQASFLVVNRGSQINAVGSATAPIIFTSLDNLEGRSTDTSSNQWGGIQLLGRAPISNCLSAVPGGSAQCQQQAEGTGSPALYGGNLPNDNSGQLRFVQIRFTGFSASANAELQGLTTGGVGAGTRIENVHIHNSGDDGVEIFGGSHNMRNIVITGADDDTIDTDFGYKGFIQFLIGIQRPQSLGVNGDTMIEADSNPEVTGADDFTPRQFTRLANFTFIQTRTGTRAIHLRGGTDYALVNGVVVSPSACLDVDQATTVQATGPDEAGAPIIRSVLFACTPFADADSDTFEDTALNAAGNTNNNTAFTSTLTSLFVNGTAETAATAYNATLLNSFFVSAPYVAGNFTQTSYVGAVRDANDTWYRSWTCDSGYASFGSNASCNTVPA